MIDKKNNQKLSDMVYSLELNDDYVFAVVVITVMLPLLLSFFILFSAVVLLPYLIDCYFYSFVWKNLLFRISKNTVQ